MCSYLTKHFVEHCTEIEWYCKTHADFKELCQDFELIAETLDFWRRSSETASERVEEYKTLLKELESRILRFLKNNPA